MVPQDQQADMAAALTKAGVRVQTVVYAGTQHAYAYNASAWPTSLAWLESNL
jgi:acetyl esterase/lipase